MFVHYSRSNSESKEKERKRAPSTTTRIWAAQHKKYYKFPFLLLPPVHTEKRARESEDLWKQIYYVRHQELFFAPIHFHVVLVSASFHLVFFPSSSPHLITSARCRHLVFLEQKKNNIFLFFDACPALSLLILSSSPFFPENSKSKLPPFSIIVFLFFMSFRVVDGIICRV